MGQRADSFRVNRSMPLSGDSSAASVRDGRPMRARQQMQSLCQSAGPLFVDFVGPTAVLTKKGAKKNAS